MSEKKYSKDHEWVYQEGEIATVGITNYAQESLGDIEFIDLPSVGKSINTGDQVGVIESVKAASDLFSPIGGEIIEVNKELKNSPQLVNSDPENSGWYMKIKIRNENDLNILMNYEEYQKIIT